jgi:long-chain acyl-CoA synthetase
MRRPRVIPPAAYKRIVHPVLLRTSDERRQKALRASEVFFPYFAMRVRYDTTNAQRSGITAPRLRDYFERLMDFAEAAKWGKAQRDRLTATTRSEPLSV